MTHIFYQYGNEDLGRSVIKAATKKGLTLRVNESKDSYGRRVARYILFDPVLANNARSISIRSRACIAYFEVSVYGNGVPFYSSEERALTAIMKKIESASYSKITLNDLVAQYVRRR
jgi:hypothetical protein